MGNPLATLISRGEGGYNDYNRGTSGGRLVGANQDIDFAQMPMAELLRRQALPAGDPDRVFAVGMYQVIPGTMLEAVDKAGIGLHETYSADVQERIFADFLIRDKRPPIQHYIEGRPGATLYAAQKAVAQEWASVDDPDTPMRPFGNYAKHGNRSSIRAHEVATALDAMRAEYAQHKQRGLPDADAWRHATGHAGAPVHVADTHAAPRASAPPDARKDAAGLQLALNALGYRDGSGRTLAVDGDAGPRTRQAVEAFQRAHGLAVDGVAGPRTQAALHQAMRAPLLADAAHPGHALYRQALQGLEQVPGAGDAQARANTAATLAFEARASGLSRIDHVVGNVQGTGWFAVQGGLSDPAHQRVYVDREQAARQSLAHSSEHWRVDTALAAAQVQVAQAELRGPAARL